MLSGKVLDMHEEMIACDLIDMLPVDKTARSFSKEFAHNLAASLKEEGLYNPIAVRPNPEKPGRYILVQGRHRLYAWFRILKEQTIRTTVLPTMDKETAAMAAIAENLWRFEGRKAQRIKMMGLWHDYHSRRHGIGVEVKTSVAEPAADFVAHSAINSSLPDQTADFVAHSAINSSSTSVAEPAAGTHPPATKKKRGRPKKNKDFVDHAVAATGKCERVVREELRLSRLFSSDELDMFTAQGTTEQQIEAIAGIKDAAKRNELVALIASGMQFEAAWKQTPGTEYLFSHREKKNPDDAATPQADPELSDEDWVTTCCADKLALLGHPEKFKAGAILYRRTAEARARFREGVKGPLADIRKAGTTDPLWGTMYRLVNIAHPKDWHNCPECGGTGEKDGVVCPKCNEAGYLLRSEKYE